MKEYRTTASRVFDTFNIIILSILTIVTIYPILYVLFASLSDPVLMHQGSKIILWPRGYNVDSYGIVFKNPMLFTAYKNTLTYVLVGTSINMLLTVFGAYALSRRYLPGRSFVMKFIVFTMFFSGGMIPNYLLVMKLGLLDTIGAMVLPNAISAWNLIIMRTYFLGIPAEMEESSKIDGANDFIVLFKVILPLALPVVAVNLLFYSVGHWNSFFSALIYLQKRENLPLQVILREILIMNDQKLMDNVIQDREAVSENVRYALIIVATLPVLFIYPFLQKYFMKGVMVGGIKG